MDDDDRSWAERRIDARREARGLKTGGRNFTTPGDLVAMGVVAAIFAFVARQIAGGNSGGFFHGLSIALFVIAALLIAGGALAKAIQIGVRSSKD